MKAEIVRLTNIERVNAGLPELTVLPELMNSAQAKADDMLANHYYGHKSPVYGSGSDMIKDFVPKAKSVAENLAPWTKNTAEAFAGWVASKEHYDHIVNPKYTHIGIGIVEGADGGYWWVQHFAKL
ncbi:MAG: CAP domain-containing protein [Oscillospiraceae bacterium]|nr:CAP domain-containing protein [Oscillospiraceae bacterium]